jgi:predicted deacylase
MTAVRLDAEPPRRAVDARRAEECRRLRDDDGHPTVSANPAAASLMALQRSAGNAAVNALLAARMRMPGGRTVREIDGGNVALSDALGASRLCEPLPVQRAPKVDPKVAAAAAQAKNSADAAADLKGMLAMVRVLSRFQTPALYAFFLRLALKAGTPVGVDSAGSPIMAKVFPGRIAETAMVVAGVHGSEQSGVEVAEGLVAQLAAHQPHFTVVVVPQLFPSNVASRAAWEKEQAKKQSGIAIDEYQKLREKSGDVGRKTKGIKDPNRQFPDLGKNIDLAKPVDSTGKLIEPSNLALLALIDAFAPTRIVSIHAVKNLARAGIFADPHPSVHPSDRRAKDADALALEMAKRAKALNVNVRGNERESPMTSLYPGQDPTQSAEQIKRENAEGISFGQWGPSRGITVITVEVGEQYRSGSAVKDPDRKVELEAEATVIREIFLGPPSTAQSPAPAAPAGSVPVQHGSGH